MLEDSGSRRVVLGDWRLQIAEREGLDSCLRGNDEQHEMNTKLLQHCLDHGFEI
jgi:hypothetical protein